MTDTGTNMPSGVRVAPLPAPHLRDAVPLCVQGMRDNPLHVRVFGTDPVRRERRLTSFFVPVIRYIHRRGRLFGAYADRRLIGVFGMLPPGCCRPRVQDAVRLTAVFRSGGSPLGTLRVGHWLWAWARNDPAVPHWHLGPLVIAPDQQGKGIGRRLIGEVAATIDPGPTNAWLETDKAVNVRLYQTYGFTVVGTATVMGVTSWFMQGSLARPSEDAIK